MGKRFDVSKAYSHLDFLFSYSVRYIHKHFEKFVRKHSIKATSMVPMIHDENEYYLLRQQLLTEPTISEHVRASRIASQIPAHSQTIVNDPLVQSKLNQRQQRAVKQPPLIVHYTYEKQFAYYKSRIHQEWNNLFHDTPVADTKLIVSTRNNFNLTRELVRRSPSTRQNYQKTDINKQRIG